MNQLSLETRAKIIQLHIEGNSIRGIGRILDISKNTVIKLIQEVGHACLKFHSNNVRDIICRRVEVDEQWSFIKMKDKNIVEPVFGIGSSWLWVAIDPETKFVISWFVGSRDELSAKAFINDLWSRIRLDIKPQLTSDGYRPYVEAVADTFGGLVDFAQLVKQYSKKSTRKDGRVDRRERYIGAIKTIISGDPDRKNISTSMVERLNLTTRMSVRRFARDTNAFSKKYANHCFALAIHFVYYNFARYHMTIRCTPAMKAKVNKGFMKTSDIVRLVDQYPLLRTSHMHNHPKNP